MEFGDRLVIAMSLADKSRMDLARALQITAQSVGQVITGSTKAMTAENTLKAARFLGVNAYWLATGEETARTSQGLRHSLSDEAIDHAALFEQMSPDQRVRLRELIAVVMRGKPHLGGVSNFGELGT